MRHWLVAGVIAAALGVAWWSAALRAVAADDPLASPPLGNAEAAAAKLTKDVDAAVARGVAWLRTQRRGDGSFGSAEGEAGLALVTLRHCAVAADDRDVVAAAKRVAADLPTGTVYGDSFGILGLLAHDAERHVDVIRKAIDRLVQAQCENGQWSYLARGRGSSQVGDNSNTQCAVFALGMARERGFEVPADVFRRVAEFVRTSRNEDGGHGYSEKQDTKSYGSMTAAMAAVHAIAIAAERGKAVGSVAFSGERDVAPPIRWLTERFDVSGNPRAAGKATTPWMYCWFWSLERAATILRAERFGTHDWYAEGAAALIARQRDSGSWIGDRETGDTCWALLFLRRSTRQWVTTPSGDRPEDAGADREGPKGPVTGDPPPK